MKNMSQRPPVRLISPSLPPLAEVHKHLEEIWHTGILSNNGPVLKAFEAALCDYLDVEHVSVVANAMLGSVVALQHMAQGGEVITTPFSFVASGNAIHFAGCTPVFADIDPETLSLDPALVERQITPRTSAIFAVHVFGIPGNLTALAEVAARHKIPLIYDAAHAFGVKVDGKSIFQSGDASIVSFHATKVFNTFEGGAVISPSRKMKITIDQLCDHGIVDETNIPFVGLNAKMSELHAAVGLAQLPYVDGDISARAEVAGRYWKQLENVKGIRCLVPPGVQGHNHYAFPILVEPSYSKTRDALHIFMDKNMVTTRRYFFPLISDLPAFSDLASAQPGSLPVARRISDQILCLPFYPGLDPDDQQRVIDLIRKG